MPLKNQFYDKEKYYRFSWRKKGLMGERFLMFVLY